MREVVIVSGVRTPIGNFSSSLKDIPVVDLGALVIKEAMKRGGLRPEPGPELLALGPDALKGQGITDLEREKYDWDDSMQPVQVDEVIMGHVLQGGQGQNTGRQATIRAGLSKETNAYTVN